MKKFIENSNKSDRIFVAAKTANAKDALEDAGYERSGFVFEMTADDLADVLENIDIDTDELDVKDEDGDPIEDIYSFAFESNDDDFEEDDDFADFEFDGMDDDDYIDPSYYDYGDKEEDF